MPSGKHGPNKLASYVSIHETIMQQVLRAGFVRSENLSFKDIGNSSIELSGSIECAGDIYTHNGRHHVHRVDPPGVELDTSPFFIDEEEDRPTLGEVVREVENWYYDHAEQLLPRVIGDQP